MPNHPFFFKNLEDIYLNLSKKFNLPIIASREIYFINKDMHEAHAALLCIGEKTYVNEKNSKKFTDEHYLKNSDEMVHIYSDLPEALENNYNFPFRCNFRPLLSKPNLPNISSDKGGNADETLKKYTVNGRI